jgi:ADP-ribosyl-[dinitrogen reductase] hydrolase
MLSKNQITKEQLEKAMNMEGGGMHEIGPGQTTDDSDLSIALAHGLAQGNGKLNIEYIAHQYKTWINSDPFGQDSFSFTLLDVGITIRSAFSQVNTVSQGQVAEVIRKTAPLKHQSLSNGTLMQITPLAVRACSFYFYRFGCE